MIASVCLSVGSFDICCSHGRSRTLYDPTPEAIAADRPLVLSVNLDSIDADGLPRNCHFTDGELKLCRMAADDWQQCLSVKTLNTFLRTHW